jgi:aconitate hydratase 2/2-methylisocitrate dehydratase
MGVGSSRMSGVNNVAFGLVKKQVHMFLHCLIVAGTNGISPIFLTTVDVTGGIGLDLKTG